MASLCVYVVPYSFYFFFYYYLLLSFAPLEFLWIKFTGVMVPIIEQPPAEKKYF